MGKEARIEVTAKWLGELEWLLSSVQASIMTSDDADPDRYVYMKLDTPEKQVATIAIAMGMVRGLKLTMEIADAVQDQEEGQASP